MGAVFHRALALLGALLWLSGPSGPARADSCPAIGYYVPPPPVASENEAFARLWLRRSGATNSIQTVDYFTVGEGSHYLPRRGTAMFAAGQREISVDVPLVDNGVLDGFKHFSLVLTNPSPGLAITSPTPGISLGDLESPTARPTDFVSVTVTVEDNERRSTVDPRFVPDLPAWHGPLPMPDGRIVIAGLSVLQPNGLVDSDFAKNIQATLPNTWLYPLQVLPDGRILVRAHRAGDSAPSVGWVRPDGAAEPVITVANLDQIAGAQPDGKILVVTTKNGSRMQVMLEGTIPGITYHIESSTNLVEWTHMVRAPATETTLILEPWAATTADQFFRARRE